MFYSDQPINTKENDYLNRTEFSKQLAKAILSYTKIDNFAISLCGKWGSGKTSILNMVVEEIEFLSSNVDAEEKPIIIKFNPWNYSDCSQLISQFFASIQTKLKISKSNKGLKEVGDALERYSSLLDYSVYIPVIGAYLGPLKGVLSGVGKQIKGNVEKGNSIEAKKQKVIETLKKQKQKLIIIIDDIDRLNNAQIRAIFQLVNSLAGFPNMIYLLSFDREVVARALQEEQQCDGEEYLEKIIQVPFEVPEANRKLVNEAFINRFENIIFDEEYQYKDFDKEYWSTIWGKCISPFIENIRDVNRVANVFEFKYGLMRDEINAIDLLALTALQVCAPTIYRWIYNNADYLTGSIESASGITVGDQKENWKNYFEIFKTVYPENPNNMMNIIQALFPKFAWKTGGYNRNRDSNDELRYKDKVASADRIKRYFNLSLEEITICKRQIQDTIHKYTKDQLKNYFMQLIQNGKIVDYVQELYVFIPEITETRKGIFVEELVWLQTLDEAHEKKNIFFPIPASKCYSIVLELLKQGNVENNAALLVELINNSNANRLTIICRIIEELEEAYARIGNYQNSAYQFVDESDLESVELVLLNKIKVLSETENYFDCKDAESLYKIWNFLEKESLNSYIKNKLQQVVNVPKYLSLCVSTWTSGRNSGWYFKEEAFSKYIEKEEAYKKIIELKNTTDFSSLKHSFKEIAAAYYLWYSNPNIAYHDIDKECVNKIITQWEKSS